jgi:hypothetical protein
MFVSEESSGSGERTIADRLIECAALTCHSSSLYLTTSSIHNQMIEQTRISGDKRMETKMLQIMLEGQRTLTEYGISIHSTGKDFSGEFVSSNIGMDSRRVCVRLKPRGEPKRPRTSIKPTPSFGGWVVGTNLPNGG